MAGKFVLTNAQHEAANAPGATPAKPTGAATSGDAAAGGTKQYVLTAESGVNLQAHLNHQVRVTGKITATPDPAAADDAHRGESRQPGTTPQPGAAADPTRSTTDRDRMSHAWPTLTVSSVTMVSATCTAGTP